MRTIKGSFVRDVTIFDAVCYINVNLKTGKWSIKREKEYEDHMDWVNKSVHSDGAMYVTEEKIEWGKQKILEYLKNNIVRELKRAQEKYDQIMRISAI